MSGGRLAELMRERGLSQSELARRVGVSQQTIHKLVTGASRGSTHLHKIARALLTTPEYLTGEIDDPDKDAPTHLLVPKVHHVMLAVALPSEPVLARMFEGLLRTIDRSAPVAEQAQLLAMRLPIGLSQLRDLMPVSATPAADAAPLPRPTTPEPVQP